MTTITADLAGPAPPGPWAPATRRGAALLLGTLGVATATGLVLYEAVETLLGEHGLGATLAGGWATLVAPAFAVVVLVAVRASGCGRPSAAPCWPVATSKMRGTSSSTSSPSRPS